MKRREAHTAAASQLLLGHLGQRAAAWQQTRAKPRPSSGPAPLTSNAAAGRAAHRHPLTAQSALSPGPASSCDAYPVFQRLPTTASGLAPPSLGPSPTGHPSGSEPLSQPSAGSGPARGQSPRRAPARPAGGSWSVPRPQRTPHCPPPCPVAPERRPRGGWRRMGRGASAPLTILPPGTERGNPHCAGAV